MIWIAVAAVLNAGWTLWCSRLLPPKVATHFGLSGQPDGWMSRRGYQVFAIVFPVALAVFLVYMGGLSPREPGLNSMMERLAVGFFGFFAMLSWCIVRSNKRVPAKIDYPSLLLSVALFLGFVATCVVGLTADQKSARLSSTGSGSTIPKNPR